MSLFWILEYCCFDRYIPPDWVIGIGVIFLRIYHTPYMRPVPQHRPSLHGIDGNPSLISLLPSLGNRSDNSKGRLGLHSLVPTKAQLQGGLVLYRLGMPLRCMLFKRPPVLGITLDGMFWRIWPLICAQGWFARALSSLDGDLRYYLKSPAAPPSSPPLSLFEFSISSILLYI